jgi:hypothetical protein
MLTPVWICFLLAVTAVPIADIPERPQLTGIDHMEIFSEVAR